MNLHEVFSHILEDYTINSAKQMICYNPHLTGRQKLLFSTALNHYSKMKKLHFCLKILQ